MDLSVFDGFLEDAAIRDIELEIRQRTFSSRSSSSKESQSFREWASYFDVQSFLDHPVYLAARDGLSSLYSEVDFEFWDVHCNNTVFGDWAFAHRDSKQAGAYSALYYANQRWDVDWFGETVFCSKGEPVLSVSVRPGRLVLFDSRIEHRAGVPAMNCPAQRLTLSLRFDADRLEICRSNLCLEVF